jgi:hypothetical protein
MFPRPAARGRVQARRLDAEVGDQAVTVAADRGGPHEPPAEVGPVGAADQQQVLRNREVADEPVAHPLLGDVAEPCLPDRRGLLAGDVGAGEDDPAAADRPQPGDCLSQVPLAMPETPAIATVSPARASNDSPRTATRE